MKISDYFSLNRSQASLDFVDVDVVGDVPVFIDPVALKNMESAWGDKCCSLLQDFFQTLLQLIKEGQESRAVRLLSTIHEPNETHLGFSRGKARGRAIGQHQAGEIVKELLKSEASKTGLLQDLEDTILMIDGIGPDIVSDITTNIIRKTLVEYTQDMCDLHGIPLEEGLDSGTYWNPHSHSWESELISAPLVNNEKLLLIPKVIVRHTMAYNASKYMSRYLAPYLQKKELELNTSLVRVLKDGERRKPYKKDIYTKYGQSKKTVVKESILAPEVLESYREDKAKEASIPLSHRQLADIKDEEDLDWEDLLASVIKLDAGKAQAFAYEEATSALLTALFYPALTYPKKQHPLNKGRKRVDLKFLNEAKDGFFFWLSQHYASSGIYIEFKNYGSEVGNPELDQLLGRFSPNRGKVGFLICRKFNNKELFFQRCIDAANADQGYIIPLDDGDLESLVAARSRSQNGMHFDLLRETFSKLVDG